MDKHNLPLVSLCKPALNECRITSGFQHVLHCVPFLPFLCYPTPNPLLLNPLLSCVRSVSRLCSHEVQPGVAIV